MHIDTVEENKTCILNKAIYSLKEAIRGCNIKIAESLGRLNFVQSKTDSCLLVEIKGESMTYIIMYVDDLQLA